jgi:hypothetical protein
MEPEPTRLLPPAEFDQVAHKIANFVDMRSPYTVGHSPGVAVLAEATARKLDLSSAEAASLCSRLRPVHRHDPGHVTGLPAAATPLTGEEREAILRGDVAQLRRWGAHSFLLSRLPRFDSLRLTRDEYIARMRVLLDEGYSRALTLQDESCSFAVECWVARPTPKKGDSEGTSLGLPSHGLRS